MWITRNDFDSGDISILCPYNRQLVKLQETLTTTGTCSIMLSDKDKENLTDLGLLTEIEQQQLRANVKVSTMVRLATVDSFQGEEAKIIILSTVRSNLGDQVGFLQTANRINVACSRARNGFYVVGNAGLLRTIDMWKTVITSFESKGRIGRAFRAHCTRHPHWVYSVSNPREFQDVPTCDVPCTSTLSCGHQCQELCHEPGLHSRMSCLRPCEKRHENCRHLCIKTCGEPCGSCTHVVTVELLACGHAYSTKCADLGKTKEKVCMVELGPIPLSCGHLIQQICGIKDQPPSCQAQCNYIRTCGHKCGRKCGECQESQLHGTCTAKCEKEYACGHTCQEKCHSGRCPPCKLPCLKSCEHGACKEICGKFCDPCVRDCLRASCVHSKCSSVCSLPCNASPCSRPCIEQLPCSHICPGLCGETCAKKCMQCEGGEIPERVQIFLPCGHNFDVSHLDSLFGLGEIYELSDDGEILHTKPLQAQLPNELPHCPQCETPCDDIRRYRSIRQLRDAPRIIDELYKKFGRKIRMFFNQVMQDSNELRQTYASFCKSLRPGPLTGKMNADLVQYRGSYMMPTQSRIVRFRGKSEINPTYPSSGSLTCFVCSRGCSAYRK